MKKILVAYDGTTGAEGALADLKQAGLPEDCEAKVLTIADVWLPSEDMEVGGESAIRSATGSAETRRHALDALNDARKLASLGAGQLRVMFPGWTVQHEARADSPAWGVLEEARRWPADMVVVGSHGRSPLEKFFLGSVSAKIVAEAPCSVRIFRPQKRADKSKIRLLIALDGSEDSKAAAAEVLNRSWPAESEVELVTIVDPKFETEVPAKGGAEKWAEPLLRDLSTRCKGKGLLPGAHVLKGDFKHVILKHAEMWRIDCIFLGARGIHHRNRLYLGTSASAVATRANCTVEVIRPKPVPNAAAA